MKISQREARRLRKRVTELEHAVEAPRRRWGQEWPGGAEIARSSFAPEAAVPVAIRTARMLNHAVVAVGDEGGFVRFIALPHPKVGA